LALLLDIATYMPALPAVLSVWLWKRLSGPQRLFGALLVVVTVISVSARFAGHLGFSNNMPLLHLLVVLEIVAFFFVFNRMLQPYFHTTAWAVVVGLFVVLAILNATVGAFLKVLTLIRVF